MYHVMIDLETLGTSADCVILTMGAIIFDPRTFGRVGEPFYARINYADQVSSADTARVITGNTLAWWMQQDEEVREEAFGHQETRARLGETLLTLHQWIPKHVKGVWGNGSDFDNAIVQHAWGRYCLDLGVPIWPYTANRCFRTFTNLFDPEREHRPQRNDHHALSDCQNQIEWMKAICYATGAAPQ
jgi:hypothetical protein